MRSVAFDRHVQMWRFDTGSRFHDGELERAFGVRPAPRKLLAGPHFHQPVRHRFAGSVQQPALDPRRLLTRGRGVAILEREGVTEKWTDRLRGRRYPVLAQPKALEAWRCDHAG